jgi:beta-lactamase class D
MPYRPLTRRRALQLGALAAVAGPSLPAFAKRETIVERTDLAAVFQTAGVVGTFVHFDGASDTFTLVDRERAQRRTVPASTFKIVNSLIALETGVVADENEVIPYGGKPQPFPAWEKDMAIAEALPVSNVPVYQEIARRVGPGRYRDWLEDLDYGNADIGDRIDDFWLDGPLAISAMEQAVLLDRLGRRELPLSRRAQDIVARITRLDARDGRTLHGKTGWLFSAKPQLGHWVGWIEGPRTADDKPGTVSAFALTIEMASREDAAKRVALGRTLLARLGHWAV